MSDSPPRSGPSAVVVIAIGSALVAVMAAVVVALSIPLLSSQSSTPQTRDEVDDKPTRTEIVLDAEWADGGSLGDDELETLEDIITGRLERAGIANAELSVDGEQITVVLDDSADDDVLEAATEALEVSFRVDFRQVLDVGLCGSGNDYTDYGPDEEVIFCDREGSTALKLAPSELTGDTIVGSTTYETSNGNGWGVTMVFDAEGTSALAAMTQRLVDSEGVLDRLAITLGAEVIESPEVVSAIENGKVSISGNMNQKQADALAAELRIAARGLTLTVASATLKD